MVARLDDGVHGKVAVVTVAVAVMKRHIRYSFMVAVTRVHPAGTLGL